MFLHTEIPAHSRVPAYCKNGSPEHLSALISLCLMIEPHKKIIERHKKLNSCSCRTRTVR